MKSLFLILGMVLLNVTFAGGQEPRPQEGVEVLTRGPVHEAYAGPVNAKPAASPVVGKEPPALIEEMPAEQKPEGDNVQWMPGYWGWDDDRENFVWVSGFWRVPPPGRDWVPGHWNQVNGGWQWAPGFWNLRHQENLTYLPPPPEPLDAGPSVPSPGADYSYVPGTWVHRETRYLWRPGYWCPCRPNWVWVPAHYVWTPCGFVFVEGYWDYPLQGRGLLFAPVSVDFNLCFRPRWSYRPSFIIQSDCFFGSLFVRPNFGHYYFGDYFDARYSRQGFTAWIDFRIGGHGYDPLFSYYRWNNRNDRSWEVGLRNLYVGRFDGRLARPPRTLVQQNTLVQNINKTNINNTTINNVTINNIKNITMVTPLAKVDKQTVKLQAVSEDQVRLEKKAADEVRAAGGKRKQLESELVAQKAVPTKSTDLPRVLKIDTPKRTIKETVQAPPLPIKSEVKPRQDGPGRTPSLDEGKKPVTTLGDPKRKINQPPSRGETKLPEPIKVESKPDKSKPMVPGSENTPPYSKPRIKNQGQPKSEIGPSSGQKVVQQASTRPEFKAQPNLQSEVKAASPQARINPPASPPPQIKRSPPPPPAPQLKSAPSSPNVERRNSPPPSTHPKPRSRGEKPGMKK